jgi:histidinol-phosphate/aromatic aminotransferase/cobyric acid decarboxylase-like protein
LPPKLHTFHTSAGKSKRYPCAARRKFGTANQALRRCRCREKFDSLRRSGEPKFSCVEKIYPTDANFVLVKTADAEKIYRFLLGEKIVVRNRSRVELCAGCLRITVGTPAENESLLTALKKL